MIEKILERLSEKEKLHKNMINDKTGILSAMDKCSHLHYAECFKEAKEIVQEVVKDGGWIPCSERLPEEHETENAVFDPLTLAEIDVERHMVSDLVLVTVRDYDHDNDFVCDDITVDGKWVNFGCESYEVIAWMPLPSKYEPKDAPYQKGE